MATATAELAKSYRPREAEDQVRARWEAAGVFHAEPGPPGRKPRPAFCIVIPPPNVTAPLHLGHAFNNTLQDILVRAHRMRGFNTLWMPGTDHAGIATQTVVEKRLLQQGIRRVQLSRDDFVARVQAWKDEYEATITEQLKAMGCSCDWERQRFTMDPVCVLAVREAFFRLFRDGLIYRGKRLVNWDPVSLTALADDEVQMEEVQGHMWYLKYPLVPRSEGDTPEHVTVATTRPETMLGDTAVAVNPADPRAAALRGRSVRLPIVDRVVPIVEDAYVVLPVSMGGDPADPKSEYATGFLKVTPAHDPNDWEIGQRHGLPVINVMAPDATISRDHGWPAEEFEGGRAREAEPLLGLSREDARAAVVKWFEDRGLLEAVRDYTHSVGHSYRSHVPIEPYLSDQWYVAVTNDRLVGEAHRAQDPGQYEGTPPRRAPGGPAGGSATGDGELKFYPARYARTFQAWHENLRDWCISRQLWWGHRIPVWSRVFEGGRSESDSWTQAGCAVTQRTLDNGDRVEYVCLPPMLESPERELIGQLEAAGYEQDPDVLDTWFSSALWPLSTMGWPDPAAHPDTVGLLETFNPTSVLCTAREIITLWVSRMVMFNRFFNGGKVPFRHVYIHAMIQDGHGQKMSKSLGNGVDPRDIIHGHGADALRFTLCQIATATQDVRLPVDITCPHCEETFHPKEITTPAGHRVAAPEQTCPHCRKKMVSGFGVVTGRAEPGPDTPLARNSSTKFDEGRNFANKLWNATRFALSNLRAEGGGKDVAATAPPERDGLALVDRWILCRLHATLHAVEDALEEYQFNIYADAMYQFVWGDFCDWYLEAIKPTVRDDPAQQQVLRTVLDAILRLLHPVCPFVTETLWPHLMATGDTGVAGVRLERGERGELDNGLLAGAAWPDIDCSIHDEEAVQTFGRLQTLVEAIRTVRGNLGVPPRRRIGLCAPDDTLRLIEQAGGIAAALAGLDGVERMPSSRPAGAIPVAFEGRELLLTGVVDAIDLDAERERLKKLVAQKERAVLGFRRKLENPSYLSKAPADVVEETRGRLAEAEADLTAARKALQSLA